MQQSSWLYHDAEANMSVSLSLYYSIKIFFFFFLGGGFTTACKHPVDRKCPSRADETVICGRCVYRWEMPYVPDTFSTGFIRNLVQQEAKYASTHLLCIGSVCMLASIHEQTQQMAYPSQCYSAHLH
jgi:hypothetical protein